MTDQTPVQPSGPVRRGGRLGVTPPGLARRMRRLRRMPLLSWRQWTRRGGIWLGSVLVGLVAVVFAAAADRATEVFHWVLHQSPFLPLLLAPAGLALAVYMTRTVFPGAQGSGIPQAIAAMHMSRPEDVRRVLSLRVAGGKVVLTLMGLCCGASIGREGPTVQIGSAIMQALGQVLRLPRLETQRAMVLAGGAAGVSAAFNTPLAGIVFAIEELSHSFESRASGLVLTGVILAGITTLALDGNYTYFGVTGAQLPLGQAWAAVLICALAGGVAGGLFAQILIRMAAPLPGAVGRFVSGRPVAFAAVCGLLLAVIGLLAHGTTYGTGYAEASSLVAGEGRLPASYFVLKFLATVVSYVSGMPGGIFAPSLAVGAGLGRWIATLLPGSPAGAVVLLGMVAYFSGVVQAPITAAVIVLEMTANQGMTIPLMATSFIAFGASRVVCRRPLYGTLARRFLLATERHAPGDVEATASAPG